MKDRLKGKIAVVTGSGSAIGQSIAERFAHEGANVAVDYRDHIDEAEITVLDNIPLHRVGHPEEIAG